LRILPGVQNQLISWYQTLGLRYKEICLTSRNKFNHPNEIDSNIQAGLTKPTAQTSAVTLIQRFGSALNLNIHFHMLFLDGVYSNGSKGLPLRFRQVKAPSGIELTQLTHTIATRVGRYLESQGLLERDTGQPYLTSEVLGGDDETPMHQLLGSSMFGGFCPGRESRIQIFTNL